MRLILVLGDQLSPNMSSLKVAEKDTDVIVMAEVMAEASYVPHHPKKIALILASMRGFAEELRAEGWQVDYTKLDDPENPGALDGVVDRAMRKYGATDVLITEPGEWRLRLLLSDLPYVTQLADDRFVASRREFQDWAEGRKELRMEFFYRQMRRKTGLLMDGDKPVGGKWNFDAENRKPAKADLFMPRPKRFEPSAITKDVLGLVASKFPSNFGDLEPFWFATCRHDALTSAEDFMVNALPQFGDYQDAMLVGQPFLYHSVLSIYLNIGLLDPVEICQRAETEFREGHAPLNAVEGFIRQIIGWREYVRGIYDLAGPDYVKQNAMAANRSLPRFYWSGDTSMRCMAEAIGQTKAESYAHHIQRLMVTGNFAMLAGVDPHHVHEWYLSVYSDAFEWVEAPNVIGMSQFADGGKLASKPYASSGAYIKRMSDYCENCAYDVGVRVGEDACPFNALYWDFLHRNRDALGKNQRLGLAYRNWDRMDDAAQKALLSTAKNNLERIEDL